MIALIIGIIATVLLLNGARKEAKGGSDWYARSLRGIALITGCVLAVLVDLIAWGIYSGVAIETTETTEVIASTNLIAIQDNTAANSQFFLGSGSHSDKTYYAFYYETDHGYKYKTIDAESTSKPVYIKYISAKETPHIDQYSIVERCTMTADGDNSWLFSIIAWLSYNAYDPGDLVSEETNGAEAFASINNPGYYDNWRYEIHIPEGSIKTDYTIDLE